MGVRSAAFLVVLLGCSSAFGLEFIIVEPQQPTPEQLRQQRQQYLDELVVVIHAKCKLTDEQIRRLSIAAKGAVQHTTEAEQMATNVLTPRPVKQLGARKFVGMRVVRTSSVEPVVAPAAHPLWIKTLQRQLTAEQVARVKVLETQQKKQWMLKRLQPQQGRLPRLNIAPKLAVPVLRER